MSEEVRALISARCAVGDQRHWYGGEEFCQRCNAVDPRRGYYVPAGGLAPEIVGSVLELVGYDIWPGDILEWTPHQLLVAYDWAIREHYHASDNPVRRKPLPKWVKTARRVGA